jgi:hypothetical protein
MAENAKTLREIREAAGLSVEDVAMKCGVDEDEVLRLEEVGDPAWPDSWEGHYSRNHGLLNDYMVACLGFGEPWPPVAMEPAPAAPQPGMWCLEPGILTEIAPEVYDALVEHAEEIRLHMTLPNPYDVHLRPYESVKPADITAVIKWHDAEQRFQEAMLARMERIGALFTEHAEHDGQKVGEVLEEGPDGRLRPKRLGSPEPPPEEGSQP